ncbi:NADH-quinone oxidoreductase subunit L [Gemmata sp. JC717]|uniref:NADH-quinone oxidoreductase subunit L n=1 Tax=Gemmata algarum TaxID=2975278 RepID=UPI0021BBB500|nr:NADH-quinone oxidoreductase subunit L [Gemmata algarum]MDY3554138.1 NADH-quinone oxidoreductase subunit L [Gemmata algarum]
MSEPIALALIVLALPLSASLLAALLAYTPLKRFAHVPLILACGSAAVTALVLLMKVMDSGTGVTVSEPLTWFAAGHLNVRFTLAVDPLSAMMLSMITFIATWIALFASGYMHGDGGFARFFAVMSLFVFSMCGLVLANNFLLLVAFWEGVGLCSYLLVGYYFEKPSAATAARKAFLVTRIGDTGFLLGIFLLWKLGGWNTDLNLLFDHIQHHPPEQWQLTTACLLLFCGAVGKSAQFPLYVWLPDAMEGPTPVSALIHAATMVTAGVYLLARCSPLFAMAPDAQIVVSWVGGITAILAAFIALAQTDLKRVLAYSTVSQLGFLFLALGTSGTIDPKFAVVAAMFHLFTHAFFKALLFLAAGSVMHGMGGVIDVRQFGGLRKVMPTTHLTFLCGAAALAGVPLLSGFWSKDLILESLLEASETESRYTAGYFALFLVACTTAFLTAFYTFRAYFLTFWGPEKIPHEAGHHAHESPPSMTIPLIVLAVGALAVGAVVEPFTHWFSHFVGGTQAIASSRGLAPAKEVPHHFNWLMAGVSAALALSGIGLAFVLYRNGGADKVPLGMSGVFKASRDKLYVDELYGAVLVAPSNVLAFLARVFDGFLDALTRLIATIPQFLGHLVRPIQNGLVQFYALSMALGVAVFLTFVVFRITR